MPQVHSVDTRLQALVDFLKAHPSSKMMVYFITCACVDFFGKCFAKLPELNDLNIMSLHGKMVPKKRIGVFNAFNQEESAILLCTDVAARGLDIPNVDWIVQLDPPQDPAQFVHRIGRTARLGRQGKAIVFLTPKEDTYVTFTKERKIPLAPMQLESSEESMNDRLRKLVMNDRELMEAGTEAFMSYLRGYKEHHCKFIFEFKHLPIKELAVSFALLRLPKMSELKHMKIDFEELPAEDIQRIPYRDKKREQQRQIRVAKEIEKNGELQAEREQRRLERVKKQRMIQKERERREKQSVRDRSQEHRSHELNELNKEARLLKKLKAGKISEREFEAEMKSWKVNVENDDFADMCDDDSPTEEAAHTTELSRKSEAKECTADIVDSKGSEDDGAEQTSKNDKKPSKEGAKSKALRPSAAQIAQMKAIAEQRRLELSDSESDGFDDESGSDDDGERPLKTAKTKVAAGEAVGLVKKPKGATSAVEAPIAVAGQGKRKKTKRGKRSGQKKRKLN